MFKKVEEGMSLLSREKEDFFLMKFYSFFKFYLFIYLIFGCVGSLLLHTGFL